MKELKFEIKIEEKPEVDPETAYKNAREKVLNYHYKTKLPMSDALNEVAKKYNLDLKTLASAVSNWKKFSETNSTSEPTEEKEKQAIKSGAAWIDEEGRVRYH